jgi:queuine tRNA-ribosyltransferase subunit QTRTD1
MGARRLPPIETPASNSYTSISILTSVGFRSLEIEDYIQAARSLRPDIVIGCGDVIFGERRATAGSKRKEKMGERSMAWTKGLIAGLAEESTRVCPQTSIWAPVLPIDAEIQREYLEYLTEEHDEGTISGLVIYDRSSTDAIPVSLSKFPRLALTDPQDPHRLLNEISLGVDLFTVPFLTSASDAGIALSFTFPTPEIKTTERLPLGVDMWSSSHARDLGPLRAGCSCYTCSNHHRAYVHHLLSAKEMLGWVLLQIHNHAVCDDFFCGVRDSIAQDTFDIEHEIFGETYTRELPAGSGAGPR